MEITCPWPLRRETAKATKTRSTCFSFDAPSPMPAAGRSGWVKNRVAQCLKAIAHKRISCLTPLWESAETCECSSPAATTQCGPRIAKP